MELFTSCIVIVKFEMDLVYVGCMVFTLGVYPE